MEFICRHLVRCCIRPRGLDSAHWERVGLYSDDEDERETEVVMPLYTFAQPQPQTSVKLDLASAGQFAVIVKNSTRLCGSGAARATVPIVQDKAYFEVKLQSGGLWAVGLCHSKVRLQMSPLHRLYLSVKNGIPSRLLHHSLLVIFLPVSSIYHMRKRV